MLHEVFSRYNKIITVEDGIVTGGFGSAVLEFMAAHQYKAEVKILGIPDIVIEHGTPKELQRDGGYDANAIAAAVREMMKEKIKHPCLIQCSERGYKIILAVNNGLLGF